MDTYDVECMIRDALVRARSEWEQAIRKLRSELRNEQDELRDDLRGIERTLHSRTDHLA